jgi:hypothetical protein
LITLLAVAVAFAIMFIVNMLASPPGNSSTGTVSPSAAQSSTASEGTEDRKFPDKVVYAGRAEDNAGAIAVAVLGDQAAAYFCDGRDVEAWFRGTVAGEDLALKSKSGATLEAEYDGDHIKGSMKINTNTVEFEINEAEKPAGLYRSRGSTTTIGWIVLEDGSQLGVQTTGAGSTAAPQLDLENPQVTVDGENLSAAPINGDEEL